jgi:hypothetical protein
MEVRLVHFSHLSSFHLCDTSMTPIPARERDAFSWAIQCLNNPPFSLCFVGPAVSSGCRSTAN